MNEIKRNLDGTLNLNSVLKYENLTRIQNQLKEFENDDYELVKKTTVTGYIPRKNIVVVVLDNGEIDVSIPSFEGSRFYEKRTYRPLNLKKDRRDSNLD